MLTFATRIHRLERFAKVILISVTPMFQNLRIGLKKRRNGKSDVPVKQRGGWPKISWKLKEQNKAAFFSPSANWCLPAPSTLKTRGKRICCRLRSVNAHDQQKGFEFRWIGNRDDIEKSDDGHNSQWRSADAWRGHSYVKELDMFLTMKVLEDTPAVLSLVKLCDEHGYSYEWDQRSKTTSH